MKNFIRVILICYLAPLYAAAQVETPIVQIPPKVVNFSAALIPEPYFSNDLNQAKALILNKENAKAKSILDKDIASTTKRSPLQKAYILEGISNYEQGKFAEAIQAYNKYFKLNAANSDVLFLKALAEIKLGGLDQAINTLNESLWFNKFSFVSPSEVNLQLSYIFLSRDDKIKANDFLSKAISVKGDSISALTGLAELQLKDGKKTEALENARKAHETDKENYEAKLLLAKALLHNVNRTYGEKEISEARNLSKEVLDKADDAQIIQDAAVLYIRSNIENNKFDEASKTVTAYLKKYPSNSDFKTLNEQVRLELESEKVQKEVISKTN